jgi:putative DNA primase/helicase
MDLLGEAQRLGAKLKRQGGGEYAGSCPACGGTDRFSVNVRKQIWNCRGCAKGGDVVDLVQHVEGVSFVAAVAFLTGEEPDPERRKNGGDAPPVLTRSRPPPAAGDRPDDEPRNLRSAARIVAELVPVRGAPGETYLREVREIDTDAIADLLERTDAIGWHPAVYFHQPNPAEPHHELHGQRLGAIAAIMSDPVTAAPTGAVSRTYLGSDGNKIGKAKTLGRPAGLIRLSRDDEVEGGLHLAEGLETGLAAMALGFRPLWATGSTSLMRVFPVLGGIESLTILADRDPNEAGEKAGKEAARRWREAGREARILRLRNGQGDINVALRKETR